MSPSGVSTAATLINFVIDPWCKILSRHCLSSLHIFRPELRQRWRGAKGTVPRFPSLLLTIFFLDCSLWWFLCFLLLLGMFFSNNKICSFSRTPKRSWNETIFLGITILVWGTKKKPVYFTKWNVEKNNMKQNAEWHKQRASLTSSCSNDPTFSIGTMATEESNS